MINYEKVGEKLFSIIKGHNHNLVMFSEDGMETNDASEARRFFVNKPNYMITLDAENRKIKFNKNRHVTLEEIESVMKQIKNLATVNMLKNEVQVFGKLFSPKVDRLLHSLIPVRRHSDSSQRPDRRPSDDSFEIGTTTRPAAPQSPPRCWSTSS